MRGGQRALADDEQEWRTGTYLDLFTPLYRELLKLGIKEHEARQMDISNVALTLGIPGPGPVGPSLAETLAQAPEPARPDGPHLPGTAPPGIPPPPWWRGDRAAFTSSTKAASELGMGGGVNVPR